MNQGREDLGIPPLHAAYVTFFSCFLFHFLKKDFVFLFSAQFGKREVVDYLLKKGADVHLPRRDGFSLLPFACEHGFQNLVELLLQNKIVDINQIRPDTGGTPLYYACNFYPRFPNFWID